MKQVTPRQLQHALNVRGWTLLRQRGSHAQWKHPEKGLVVTIPAHGARPIPPGTLKAILSTTEISIDEL